MRRTRCALIAVLVALALPCPAAAEAAAPRQVSCPPIELADGERVPVDLNRADEQALLGLPGIGPARAQAILAYRAAHGRFRSVSQLLQIRGIGRALLKQLRPLVTISEAAR